MLLIEPASILELFTRNEQDAWPVVDEHNLKQLVTTLLVLWYFNALFTARTILG